MIKVSKEDIIKAALSLFSEKGYSSTSVDEIARKSGMVKATFYKFFKSKDQLLLDTITSIEKDMEKEFEKVYLNLHQSPREKLTEFYSIALNRVYQNKMHLLIFTMFLTEPTDKQIGQAVKQLENNLSMRLLDLMKDLYGHELKDYYYDIIFVVKSVIISYLRMNESDGHGSENLALPQFITSITDMLVTGMRDPNNHHEILWKPNNLDPEETNEATTKWKQIGSWLKDIHAQIDALNVEVNEKQDYYRMLDKLREELISVTIDKAHIRALLLFLEQLPELRGNCKRIKDSLKL